MTTIKLYIAKKNPQFTSKDTDRPYFYNKKLAVDNGWTTEQCVQNLKQKWLANTFESPINILGFNEYTTLTASINFTFDPVKTEDMKAKSYIALEVNGFIRFYFITSCTIKNESTCIYQLELDTITTYLDKIKYKQKSALISRAHDTRWLHDKTFNVLKPNYNEHSTLWNVDPETAKYSTVVKGHMPIDVLRLTGILDQNQYDADAIRDTYWPVAVTNARAYDHEKGESGWYPTDWMTPLVGSPRLTTGYSTVMMLNPFSRHNGKINLANANEREYWATPGDINYLYPDYITKILALPLPYSDINLKWDATRKDVNILPDIPFIKLNNASSSKPGPKMYDDPENKIEYHVQIPKADHFDFIGNVKHNGSTDFTEKLYVWMKDKKELGLSLDDSVVAKGRDVKFEAKLLSGEHRNIIIKSSNGNEFKILPEFLYKDADGDTFALSIGQFLGSDGAFQVVTIGSPRVDVNDTIYDREAKINGRRFIVPYYDQLPNASDKYADFMRDNGQQYKTSITANKAHGITSAIDGIIGMTASVVTGGIGGALYKGATSAMSKAYGVQGGVQGAAGVVSSIGDMIAKNAQMAAQVTDLKKQGTTTELANWSITKDAFIAEVTNFGDSKLALVFEEHPEIHKQMIADYYNKFGYPVHTLRRFTGYDSFANRYIFNYIEAPKISDAFDLSNLSPEIQSNIDGLFGLGVRLWTVDSYGSVDNINDYRWENWEWDIAIDYWGKLNA